ncbi:MAG: RagB/SusD family nutrient uptake outer membrane protein [Bacteroidales bacterium]|nr:RagB/SusD family nutrient uptake outer membrane protein [Bacteroidales bacterium]
MKIRILLLAILTALQFSCSDWMELIPPTGLIREEYWQTKEDVKAAVMGAYDSFAQLDGLLFKFGEMRADLVQADNNLSLDDQKVMEGNIYPDNYLCNWFDFYKVINYCNEILLYAPGVKEKDNTFTDYQLQGYLSEAYFLRSLTYFYLVRIFGDVPFATKPTESDDADIYLPKTNSNEILEQILSDLKYARSFATVDGYPTLRENKGRATKAAFDALLADISLWTFDYEACITYVQNIELSKKYELMPGDRWFELFYPGNSLEGIFELQYDNALSQNNRLYGLTQRYSYNFDPSEKALYLFGKEYVRELKRGEDVSIKKYADDDFIIWKYVGRSADGYTARTGTDQNSCNWIIYRLADVLLMKAEALSQIGRYTEALQILNDIRDRADVPLLLSLANSAMAFEDAILEERARELAFEGKRWFDLLRMGRRNNYSRKSKLIEVIVANVPSTQKRVLAAKLTNPLGWYLPIYESEIERNKNLVQNPYYNF